jgi:hypothetical protein
MKERETIEKASGAILQPSDQSFTERLNRWRWICRRPSGTTPCNCYDNFVIRSLLSGNRSGCEANGTCQIQVYFGYFDVQTF